ncbi:MAG: patatin-like phospholipase family protein, partial [Rhizobiaceae bacterium]
MKSVRLAILFVCTVMMAGCVTASVRTPYTIDELVGASVYGQYGLRFFPGRDPDLQSALGWSAAQGGKPPPPADGRFDILALSSGGPDGAYGAGIMKGLTESGRRQEYEIVTGVSTGALIAPFAFIGSRGDSQIEKIYTSGEIGKVIGRPNVFAAVSGPALYPASGIDKLIAQYVDGPLLAKIAAEHESGRRLLIATANIDANQLTVWNMGAIAKLGDERGLSLFRDILRGAIAVPGALAPVEVNTSIGDRNITELHGDAGVLSYFYAEPGLIPAPYSKPGKNRKRSRADIILHNQIEAPPANVEARSLK